MKAFRGCEVDLLFDPRTVARLARSLLLGSVALLLLALITLMWLDHQIAESEQKLQQLQAEQRERQANAAAEREEEQRDNRGLRAALNALSYPWHKEFEALGRAGRHDSVALLSWSVERATSDGRVTLLAESFDAVEAALNGLNEAPAGAARWQIVQLSHDASVPPYVLRAVLARQKP